MRRFSVRALVVIGVIAFAGCSSARTGGTSVAPSAVTVQRDEPRVSTREFSSGVPPADMPPLRRGTASITQSKYGCNAVVDVDSLPGSPRGTIAAVRLTLTLEVIHWLPTDVTPKLRQHAQGHEQISRIAYEHAEKSVRDAASLYLGRQVAVSTDGPGLEIERIAAEIAGRCLDAIQGPADRAHEHFTQLTDSGRNEVDEGEAVRMALAAEGLAVP